MRVHFIDLGQSDATLFEFPCAAVLVDAGGESNSLFDGNDELELYLDQFFELRGDLNTLSAFYITHPHIDHTRGAKVVRYSYAPDNVITNGKTSGSGRYGQKLMHRYAADFKDDALPVGFCAVRLDDIPADGLTGPVIDPVDCFGDGVDPELTVLWGQVESNPGWSSNEFDNGNNHSVILRVDFGNASVLLTGDLEERAIEDLVERYAGTDLLDVDVYQVGHHGSKNGTTDELVEAMSPEMAVFSCGPAYRETSWTAWAYGHPRKVVVDSLQDGVSESRGAIEVDGGLGAKNFTDETVTQAVYATAWDGTVVLEVGVDGDWKVVSPASDPSMLVNLNTASADELDTLPWIGPAKASAIITDRETNGLFADVNDLVRVSGIGPATLEEVRALVTL